METRPQVNVEQLSSLEASSGGRETGGSQCDSHGSWWNQTQVFQCACWCTEETRKAYGNGTQNQISIAAQKVARGAPVQSATLKRTLLTNAMPVGPLRQEQKWSFFWLVQKLAFQRSKEISSGEVGCSCGKKNAQDLRRKLYMFLTHWLSSLLFFPACSGVSFLTWKYFFFLCNGNFLSY